MNDILSSLRISAGPDLLVGYETSDDAAVYRLDDERALVSTADFITPVVDDPATFGRIAAANSLSDIYAMGGVPLLALNLLGFPPVGLPHAVLGEILAGAAEVCAAAGCAVGGGHTVRDDEVKFGLSVTGLVHPDRILRNCTARAGDRLILTKPLGTGALVAAMKKGLLPPEHYQALVDCMTALNRQGPELAGLGATACTDVTGFGLSGHALEMAVGSKRRLTIECGELPLLPDAVRLCGEGFTCGGTNANSRFGEGRVRTAPGIGPDLLGLLHDPQTSGGLLISAPEDRVRDLQVALANCGALAAAVIGKVDEHHPGDPYVDFV